MVSRESLVSVWIEQDSSLGFKLVFQYHDGERLNSFIARAPTLDTAKRYMTAAYEAMKDPPSLEEIGKDLNHTLKATA